MPARNQEYEAAKADLAQVIKDRLRQLNASFPSPPALAGAGGSRSTEHESTGGFGLPTSPRSLGSFG